MNFAAADVRRLTSSIPTGFEIAPRDESASSRRRLQVRSEPFLFTRFQSQLHDLISVTHLAASAVDAADGRARELAVFPCHVHFETAARAQSFHRTRGPGGRQRG